VDKPADKPVDKPVDKAAEKPEEPVPPATGERREGRDGAP
jgi:hypothetical protein